MRFLLTALLLCLPAVADEAAPDQDPKPGTSSSSSPVKKEFPAIRRFSAGGYIAFSGLQLMSSGNATATVTNTKGTITGTDSLSTGPKGSRIGGGALVQVSITGRYAAAAEFIFRNEKYHTTGSTVLSGKTSSTDSYTTASVLEMPFLARRYSKTRTEPGARWFIETGPSLRWTHNVRTSTKNTDTAGVVTCCTDSVDPLSHSLSLGYAVGGGYQLVDQLGVHVIPGIRYTRWIQPSFNNLSAHSNPNQVEAGISITF